ncbi:hypothetical protein LEN26_015367 [Aphanomyces euteiches]|nr:hypothetical protein LEN26_015367 [Aphanomyces euteiches]KAH9115756.1 hypothetical protein AeMF1_010201 [Aphanomyces euteiches]KAH9197076.1 hypothetical protein AeNC1_000974 [Aphanomyces euteiches]
MSTLKLPLSDDFFHIPPLSAEQIEEYRAIGRQAAADLVQFIDLTGGAVDWTFHSKTSSATMYASRCDGVPIFRACAKLEAALEDVISIFLTPTTSETRQIMAAYLPVFLDKVRLLNISMPTLENLHYYQSLNWTILKTPLGGVIMKHRDLIYVEHQEEVIINGKRAWLRALTHVDIPGCPSLEDRYGIVRGEFLHTGSVYMETDVPGVLENIAIHHNRPNGKLTGAVGDFLMSKVTNSHYRAIKEAEQVVRAHQLSRLEMIAKHHLPPVSRTAKCDVCLKKLGILNDKDYCRRCAKIVCTKSCSKVWKFLKSGIQVRARVCRMCSNAAKQTKLGDTSYGSFHTQSEGYSFTSSDESVATSEAFSCYTGSSYAPSIVVESPTAISLDETYARVESAANAIQLELSSDTSRPKEAPFGTFA